METTQIFTGLSVEACFLHGHFSIDVSPQKMSYSLGGGRWLTCLSVNWPCLHKQILSPCAAALPATLVSELDLLDRVRREEQHYSLNQVGKLARHSGGSS